MSSTDRREFVRIGGILVCGGLAGCLSDVREFTNDRPTTSGDEPETTREQLTTMNDEPTSETVENEPDSESIDGRLRNEDDVEHVFHVTITDEGGSSRDGSFDVGAGETTRIPAVGSPGDVLTVEVRVGDTDESETLELGGEAKPGELAGFVDVVYRADGEIEIAFEPTD